MSTEIKFVTSEAHEKNARGETCYQAQLRHNAVLNEKETKQAFAAHSGRRLSDVTYYVDSLSEFIAQAVTDGHRLDFGNTDYKLTGPLKRGSYWLVIQSRYKDEPALIRVRRRVTV